MSVQISGRARRRHATTTRAPCSPAGMGRLEEPFSQRRAAGTQCAKCSSCMGCSANKLLIID
eukprot:6727525-Lingulodinium_polyedra.AAC.1